MKKGVISFIPLSLLAIIMGLILIVSNIIISTVVSVEAASKIIRNRLYPYSDLVSF
ncbi:MAG: hypothetical protein Ct9H90mP2_13930 [Dehalococcoidia bacterium]|nr:MAG: hypothetical protein Ct9H90mP2_13930 [Dehalococcoidia bacterium]